MWHAFVWFAVINIAVFATFPADAATIINVPPEVAPASIGSDTQLNLFDTGSIQRIFNAGASDGSSTNVELNIYGGTVGGGMRRLDHRAA